MTSNGDVSKGFGVLPTLPKELLVDVTKKDCKGCCDGDKTQQSNSSDSGIGTETERESIERKKREESDESFVDTLTSSSGSSSGRSGRSGSARTKSGKTIKDYKSLTIGSLDLGTSGTIVLNKIK